MLMFIILMVGGDNRQVIRTFILFFAHIGYMPNDSRPD
jgi:hypothetical protein